MNLTCKEAARLVSEGLDRNLPASEQLRLKAHLAICRGCQSLSDRLSFLRRAVKKIAEREDSGPSGPSAPPGSSGPS
jgi:predicted anti-sigma-YlaC factor YlaD